MSLGFQNADYEIVAAYDNWQLAVECYNANFKHQAEQLDLTDTNTAIEKIKKVTPQMIVGGPPCQDFSIAGSRVEGARASLTVSFANIISKVLPEYFVMENVETVITSNAYKVAREIFINAGYGLTERVLNSSNCGVPQRRKRFFCIGHLHDKNGFINNILSANQSVLPLSVREYFSDFPVQHYYRHPRTYGRRAIISIDEPAPTIRGVNRPRPPQYKEHPKDSAFSDDIRALSYYERGIIQTFPPNYIWIGTNAEINQMVGNAVPVKLAQFIAQCVKQYTEDNTNNATLAFLDWLCEIKCFSSRAASDVLSRLGRANKILSFDHLGLIEYVKLLRLNDAFNLWNKSIKAQVIRAVRLYYEYAKSYSHSPIIWKE